MLRASLTYVNLRSSPIKSRPPLGNFTNEVKKVEGCHVLDGIPLALVNEKLRWSHTVIVKTYAVRYLPPLAL
jgi:hypothetical protein